VYTRVLEIERGYKKLFSASLLLKIRLVL
jgi:hypothetical protein